MLNGGINEAFQAFSNGKISKDEYMEIVIGARKTVNNESVKGVNWGKEFSDRYKEIVERKRVRKQAKWEKKYEEIIEKRRINKEMFEQLETKRKVVEK